MVLQCWSCAPNLSPSALFTRTISRTFHLTGFRRPRKSSKFTCHLKFGVDDIAQIAHNKVLIAASVSAAIGQLSKPFTSQLLYGKDFDFKAAFRAGGFPSTHSSAVVAAATSLALERGLSDSIFGLTVVYASLVMYDAQGVRREVGNHARALNQVLPRRQINSNVSKNREKDDLIDSQQATSSTLNVESLDPVSSTERRSLLPNSSSSPLLVRSENKTRQTNQILVSSSLAAADEGRDKAPNGSARLKESIGHSEVEVIAGALFGFFVSITVYNTMAF